ncbi:hypothetical protein RB195_011753 [Necator americanus]
MSTLLWIRFPERHGLEKEKSLSTYTPRRSVISQEPLEVTGKRVVERIESGDYQTIRYPVSAVGELVAL